MNFSSLAHSQEMIVSFIENKKEEYFLKLRKDREFISEKFLFLWHRTQIKRLPFLVFFPLESRWVT